MKKVLIGLLAYLCVGTAVCGFAACKDEATATGTGTGSGLLGGGINGGTTSGGSTSGGSTSTGTSTSTQVMVILDANGGEFENEEDAVQLVDVNTALTAPTPVRDGYVLKGWALNASGTLVWDTTKNVTTGMTLYAIWKKDVQEYDVTFHLNYEGAEQVVLSTEEGKVTYVPEREGYVFRGWWLSTGNSQDGVYELTTKFNTNNAVSSSDLVLYAEWVAEEEASAYLSTPVVSVIGETFSWNEVEGAESYHIQVYYNSSNVYSATEYDTSWDFYDGGYGYGTYTVYVRANGDGETKVNSSYTSMTYKYRMLDTVSNIYLDPFTSLLTWSEVQHADEYEVYVGGEYAGSTYNTKFDMSDYTVGTYSVAIYAYDDEDYYHYVYTTTSVKKLRLNEPINLSCSFDLEENEYTFSWNSVTSADAYVLSLNGSTYTTYSTQYTVSGDNISWNENDQVVYSVKAQDSYHNYLASYETEEQSYEKVVVHSVTVNDSVTTRNNVHTVTFHMNDSNNTVYDVQYVTENDGLEYPALPTRSDYVFKGWYTEYSCENLYDFTAEITEDITLYAGWHYMSTSGYSNHQFDPITYNSSSNSYSFTTYGSSSTYAQYRYFQTLTSGSYTLYYRNYMSGGTSYYYNTYLYVYNATQNTTIKSNSSISYSSSYASVSFNANAGDVIYIRTYRYYSSYPSYFYFYVTGAQMPADGGLASNIDYSESTMTTEDRTSYYRMGDTATLKGIFDDSYTFNGWYDENDALVSEDKNYTFTVGDTDVTYTAKWAIDRSSRQGLSFYNTIETTSGNSYVALIENAGQMVYYSFKPTVSGYYRIYSSNNNYDTYGYLYNASYSLLESNDDGAGNNNNFMLKDTYLTAGYTYYIGAKFYNNDYTGSFVVTIELPGGSFEEAIEITKGSTYTTISTGGQYVYYKFQPAVSGNYTVYSSGGYDTYGYLYNSSYTQLTSHDGGSDFSYSYDMTAGETYYIVVKMYSSSATASFYVNISQNN